MTGKTNNKGCVMCILFGLRYSCGLVWLISKWPQNIVSYFGISSWQCTEFPGCYI